LPSRPRSGRTRPPTHQTSVRRPITSHGGWHGALRHRRPRTTGVRPERGREGTRPSPYRRRVPWWKGARAEVDELRLREAVFPGLGCPRVSSGHARSGPPGAGRRQSPPGAVVPAPPRAAPSSRYRGHEPRPRSAVCRRAWWSWSRLDCPARDGAGTAAPGGLCPRGHRTRGYGTLLGPRENPPLFCHGSGSCARGHGGH
jgi:hypothetical protein